MMDRLEHGPEDIAFELERTLSFGLELGRVAMLQCYGERFVGVAPRLSNASPEIIETA